MATDPMNPMARLGLNWGAAEQPVDPAPVPSGSLDASVLEAMAAGPQLDPRASATQTRIAGVKAAAPARAERLEGASAHRRALLGDDPAVLEREALARAAGNMSRVDTTTLPSDQEFATEANIFGQQWRNAAIQTEERSAGEIAADTGLAIGKGLTTGLGSLGTLGAAVIDPEWGIAVAKGTQDAGQWFDGYQSETLQERGRLTRIENELDQEDNELRRLQDIRDGSSEFMADVRQVGRDFLSSIDNYSDDIGQMGNITAEGVGSLVGSSGIGGIVSRLVSRGIAREASRQLAERAVMGGVMGLMEGGDAYGNAALEVMNMSEKTLNAQSDEYRGLRAAGFSHEEAQIELAHESGMTAAAIAVPAGAVAGAMVGRFEAAPLSFRGAGVADAARTTAAQFAEETFQEGMSQFSGNVGLRWSGADPNRDLTEGVGEAGAMGGIGGAGMAAGLRGGVAAVRAPAQIIAGVGAAGEAVGRVADAREERNFQRNSPVSDTAIAEALAQAAPAQERVAEAVQNMPPVQESEPDPVKERAKAELEFLMNIGDDELNTLMPNVRDVISGRYRADGLFALVQELDGDRLTQKEKDQALLYIKARLPTIGAVVGGNIREQAESLYPGMGIAEDIDTMAGSIGQMIQNPKVAQALGIELTQEQIDSLTENSPENTIMAAQVAPTMIDPARAREALNHSTNGTLRVNPQAIRFLAMSADLGDLIQEYKGTLDQTFGSVASEGTNRVRAEALVTGRTNRKELSMVQHIDRISSDVRNGQLEEAKANMEEFKLFVDGQRNKLNAMEQSKKNNDGNAVSYARNTPMGWAEADNLGSGKVTYLLGKGAEKSENLLQNMRADTRAMERAYARVAEAFPEMQAAPMEPPQGRRPGLKDLEIEAQDEIAWQEAKAKADKPYRPRKGTVLPSALGSLVERNVSEETAQSIATKIDLHMDDEGRVPRDKFTKQELKVFRDTYGIPIHHKTIRIPDDLAEQTRAVREELARIEDERQIELPLEEPAQPTPKQEPKPVKQEPKKERLVNDEGKPITFYHGTRAAFTEFKDGMTFWTSQKGAAGMFGRGKQEDGPLRVIEAEIEGENVAYVDAGNVEELDVYQNQNAVARDKLLADGHDVIVYFNDQGAALVITTKNSQVIQKKAEAPKAEVGKNFDFSDLDYEWERENLDDMISMMPPDDEVAIQREKKKLDDAFEEEIKKRDAAWDAIGEVSQTMVDILSGELTSEEMNSIVWNKSVANDEKVSFLNKKLPKSKKEKIKELQRDFVIQYRLDNQKQGNALFYDEVFEYLLENKPANNNKVVLPVNGKNKEAYRLKDQAKADKANKFIGRGNTLQSSTRQYAEAWGDRANMGVYDASDVVMLSAEGRRRDRFDPDYAEIQRAMDAGATLIGDTPKDRSTYYNLGEQQMAAYMEKNGYVETSPGVWQPADRKTQEGEIVSEEEPEVTLSDLVPKTNERFRNVYSLRKDGSKLLAQTSPIEAVRNQIMSSNKGGVLNEAWNRLLNLSGKMTQQMNKKLRQDKTAQDFIQKLKAGHVFKTGNTVLDTAAGRSLALLDQETGQFETRIAEVGGLAFVHWLMNERKPDINRLEDTDVADIFRISPNDVTQAMIDVVASGNYIENAVASLADTITKFAGLAPVNGVSRSDAGGIILGLAAELMDAAIELGLISISDQTVEINRNGKTENWPYRAVIIDNETVQTFQSNMTQSGELSTLEEIIVPDADKAFYIGEPPTKIDPTQMKNRETELTAREKKAIQKEQNKPAFVNTPFVNMMKAIGRDNWLTLMGYQDASDSVPMNPQHRKSVEGKNTSLVYGWDGVMGHVAAVDRYAAENQMAQDEVPSFWAYGISLVGRLQQRGFGPQADKQAREALTATVATLDLTDPAQDDRFWMTVAQSIGVKTEKVSRADAVAKAKKMMSHPLAEEAQGILFSLVQNPEAGLSDNESKSLLSLFAEMADRDSKSGFGPANPKLVHAFLAVARYWDAKENGTDTAFKHNLALESDGKTDGPINAIMNFLSGSFNATQLMLMSMGGFFVNRVNKTLNSHFMDGGKDLYEHTSELLEGRIQTMLATMEPQPKAALETVLKLLGVTGNVSYADGKLTIGRGVVKNPLTVSVYGAGETGIAGKVTREVMDAVYERFTKSLTGMDDVQDLVNQLSSLVNNKIVYSKKKGKYFVFPAEHKSPIGKVDASKFVLNSEQYTQLRDNIKVLFSDPMVDSINEMMGATKKTMSLMQQSTQVQAIIAQERFRNRVAEIKANKKPGEDLSEKEYFEVFKEIAPYGAQIFMPDQSANIGVSEKLGAYNPDPNKRDTDMVRALGNDRVSGNLKTIQPSDAGVKAAPFMVIMTGDAKMILRLASNGLEKTLMVFDGIEMAADLMDIQSLEINKQVSQGWNQDTSQAVADSFENFMRQNPLNTPLSLEARQKLARVFGVDRDIIANLDVLYTREDYLELVQRKQDAMLSGQEYAHFDNQIEEIFEKYYAGKDFFGNQFTKLAQRVRNTSDEIRARKEALQEFGYSVDHMASAEQPYSEGANKLLLNDDGTPLDDAILVQRMNEVYTEKLNQIKKDRGERQTREAKNTGLVSLVQEGAAAVRGRKGGAVSLSVSQMFKAVKTAKNSHQRAMLYAALTALRGSGYTFHFGTREELVKLRETLSPGIDQALDLGQTDPVGKHVYVASATTETALHEAIHAATIDKVFSALTDPENTPVAIRESVDRLGLLMEEFMGFDFTQLAGDQAGLDAQATIDVHLKKGTEAGRVYAINEFMAWSLSNQHLIEIMQRTKVRNPLARVAFKVMRVIKGLLGMGGIPDNMYQNIRFNTQVILNESMEMDINAQAALDHTVNADAYTALVMKRFNNVFRHYMNNLKVEDHGLKSARRSMKAKVQADLNQKVNRVADTFQAAGFNFSAQQQQAFKSIQRAMMTEVELHKPSLLRAQTMFRHVLDNLKPEHFMVNPQSTNPNDIRDAQDKFNAITGAYGIQRDIAGRSSLLGSFLALSQVDPQFRKILRGMKPPKGDGASPVATSRFDEIVTESFNTMTDRLASVMYDGPNRGSSVGQTIDNLIDGLSTVQSDSRTLVEKSYDTIMNKAENKSVELIQMGVDGGIEALDRIKAKSKSRIVRGMTEAAKAVASLGSNRYSEVYANALTTIFNNDRTPIVIRDFFAELRGTNALNENLHNMVGKVKYEVSATRQDFLEVLPHTILNQFKSKMSPEQWASLSRSVAATDLGNLMSRYSLNTVRELVSDGRKLNGAIASAKSRLQAKDRVHALAYETKAEALATYMITGEITSKNLLTNAVAISRLLGERNKPSQTPDQETINMIDDLVSLLALSKVQKADRDYLADRLTNETEGMDFMLRYINELDRRERAKTTNQRAIFNQIKGRMDTVRSGSDQIIVAEESEFKRLARISYTRLADYKGDSNDKGIRAYFYSPVKGQSTYHQGVMQTVQSTSYGVDSYTGYMVGNTGGRITGAAAKRIAKDLANQKKDNLAPGEYLKPVYNERGEMVAFERMLSPEMLSKIKKDDHLATRIGAWRGRQAEEGLARQYNTGLVGVLHDYWNNEKDTRDTEYVNLADPQNRDAVLNHIWSVIPKEMKTEIGQVFGFDIDGNPIFMVRKDMLNDALGYPGASVGDFFTGNNRINPQVNEAIRKGLTAIMGPPAYQWLVQTERGWQSAVSATKATIVIRSVVVPFANIVSNIVQMLARRVPLRSFGKPLMHKVHETNVFLRNKVRLAELEAQGIAARGDTQRVAALRAKYRAIEDENKRLSIWPLIDRGEFASIADGLSEADKVVDNRRLMDMIEDQVNKLPEGVRTAGKYAIVSRDTALFKLLNRSVQYGDFIAKALVYDHKLSQGNSPEDAYRAIRNEFVNYNLLPGRVRTTLEGLGLLWFWNFKIRTVKVALDTLRNNPLTALLWSMSPIRDLPIEGINDGPLTDNLFWKGLMDKLHHSMGPGMISMIFESNPWIRFIGN